MKKLRKIISNRGWEHKSSPMEVFENRLKDMMNLEILTISSKLPESAKNEAKKQYLVMLVTCYETYLRGMFKKIITEQLVPFSKIMKLKKLKEIRFTLEEVELIKNENIEFAELVCGYINFQNFKEMKEAFSLIGFDKKIDKKIEEKDDVMPLPSLRTLKKGKNIANKFYKDFIDFVSYFSITPSDLNKKTNEEEKDNTIPPSKRIRKKGGNTISEFYKEFTAHKKMFNKAGLYSQINLLLEARHKIIHQNIDIKIFQEDVMVMTATIYEFIFLLNKIIEETSEK